MLYTFFLRFTFSCFLLSVEWWLKNSRTEGLVKKFQDLWGRVSVPHRISCIMYFQIVIVDLVCDYGKVALQLEEDWHRTLVLNETVMLQMLNVKRNLAQEKKLYLAKDLLFEVCFCSKKNAISLKIRTCIICISFSLLWTYIVRTIRTIKSRKFTVTFWFRSYS